MSYASSRTQQSALTTGVLLSADVGSKYQPTPVATPLVLASGVVAPLITIQYPIGVYTGWVNISYTGDNTTAFDYLTITEDNEGGGTNQNSTYNIATTLPSNDIFWIKYPITIDNLNNSGNEVTLSAVAEFAGTAPTIQSIYMFVAKVV
jgi:hypothetical protein